KYRKIASYLRSEKGKKVEITNFLQKEGEVLATRSALSPLVILSTDTIYRRLEGIYNYELLLIKSVNILIAEDKLEDKPGDTIEVIIEDKPEDIPDERPLPTNTSIREKT
ncbi:hypothetical protein N7445_010770, partial [Penicillium cf. griseofulvum]